MWYIEKKKKKKKKKKNIILKKKKKKKKHIKIIYCKKKYVLKILYKFYLHYLSKLFK